MGGGAQGMKSKKKILTTFSIEPSFKEEFVQMFDDMGLSWAAGARFAVNYPPLCRSGGLQKPDVD